MTPELVACLAFNRLVTDHPGWVIWRSDLGRWWGIRKGRLTMAELEAGLPVTVSADDPGGLDDILNAQDSLTDARQHHAQPINPTGVRPRTSPNGGGW